MNAHAASLNRSRPTNRRARGSVSWATRSLRTKDRYRALLAVAR